eukprot:416171_1
MSISRGQYHSHIHIALLYLSLHLASPLMAQYLANDLQPITRQLHQTSHLIAMCCQSTSAMTTARILAYVYDIFTAIVSLLDVITDIIVLVEFYIMGRMAFFYASLTILIIAQLAYCIAFWYKFRKAFATYCLGSIGFCCLLPFAPILSFAFFFTDNRDTRLYQLLEGLFTSLSCDMTLFDCCQSSENTNTSSTQHNRNVKRSPEMEELRQWVKNKLVKHIGFIIEALIEAFPQSILQLIAIVYYSESNNYISMCSILLSMISVSTKSFILSVLASYNLRSAIFNWLCCITDFFGIFFIISFAFYVPSNADSNQSNPFAVIQSVWIYSILFTVIPFALIGSIGMNIFWTIRLSKDYWYGFAFFVQIAWIVGLSIAIMSMIIGCFLFVAAFLMFSGLARRIRAGLAAEFYLPLTRFIKHATRINRREEGIVLSKKQDKIIRICCVNRVLLETMLAYNTHNKHDLYSNNNKLYREHRFWSYNAYDKELHQYLRANTSTTNMKPGTIDYPYSKVTLKALKIGKVSADDDSDNTRCVKLRKVMEVYERIQDTVSDVLDELMHAPFVYVLKHICLPLYAMGRLLNITFAVFIICYLSLGHQVHIFTEDVPLFQTIMFCCYLCLLILWIVALSSILKQTYWMSFILPTTKRLRSSEYQTVNKQKTKEIMQYYECLIYEPSAKYYCIQRFGKDIAVIIMTFYGHSKEFQCDKPTETTVTSDGEMKAEEQALLLVYRPTVLS